MADPRVADFVNTAIGIGKGIGGVFGIGTGTNAGILQVTFKDDGSWQIGLVAGALNTNTPGASTAKTGTSGPLINGFGGFLNFRPGSDVVESVEIGPYGKKDSTRAIVYGPQATTLPQLPPKTDIIIEDTTSAADSTTQPAEKIEVAEKDWSSVRGGGDPLVLNFSGHQVHTTAVNTSSAHFDLANTGTATVAGWITTDEGFLVIAPPSGQAITNGSQLIPTFASLAALDTNHDGILDSRDAGFANLRVWQNSTDDGVFHADQLHTLQFEGVASINLGATDINAYDNGNFVMQDSSFMYNDGSTGDVASVLLSGGAAPIGNTLYVTSTSSTLVTADGQVIEAVNGGTGHTYDAGASGVSALVGGQAGDTFTAGNASYAVLIGADGVNLNAGTSASVILVGGAHATLTGTGAGTVEYLTTGNNSNVYAGATNNLVLTAGDNNTVVVTQNNATVLAFGANTAVNGVNNTGLNVATFGAHGTINVGANATVYAGGDSTSVQAGVNSNVTIAGTNDLGNIQAGSTVSIAGSNNQAVIGAGATVLEAGSNNSINVGTSSNVTLQGTQNFALVGANGTVLEAGNNNTVYAGTQTNITVTGTLDQANIANNSNALLGGVNSTVTATTFANVTVTGTGDVATTGAGSNVLVSGNGNWAFTGDQTNLTLSGNSDYATTGTGSVALLSGTGDTLVSGTQTTVGISGNTDALVSGAGSSVAVTGNHNYIAATSSTVSVASNLSVDVVGDGMVVNAASNNIVGVYGSGDTTNVSGTGTGVWVGRNGQYASAANDDVVNLAQGGVVFVSDNSRVDVFGNSATVLAGSADTVGLYGTGNSASLSGSNTGLWLGGGAVVSLGAAGEYLHTNTAQLANDVVSGLAAGNGIDISDLIPGSATLGFTANATGGVAALTDGVRSTQFQLNGSYNPANLHLAADGYGGIFLSYG